jgi:hypothetical protein
VREEEGRGVVICTCRESVKGGHAVIRRGGGLLGIAGGKKGLKTTHF